MDDYLLKVTSIKGNLHIAPYSRVCKQISLSYRVKRINMKKKTLNVLRCKTS